MSLARVAATALLIPTLAAGCGGSSAAGGPDGGGADAEDGGGDAGAAGDALAAGDASAAGDAGPLQVPAGTWTWVDIPGTACDDGSMTGIGVNPAPGGSGADLLVFLNGGGACWDATTCLVLNTATHGPFGSAQFTAAEPALAHGFDRTRATNPFRGFSYVFVPYCTGDLHAGSNVATYTVTTPVAYHHVGRINLEVVLPRVQATWPAPARVVVSGSSAGGFGATLNYDLFRRAYPDATVSLVDDSGPFLEGDAIPPATRAAWNTSWHLGDVVDPLCAFCGNDLSQLYPALAALYPQDRMALLSSLQDQTISTYFQLSGADFQAKLQQMIADWIDPSPRFHTFLIPGTSHTMLGTPDTIMAGGLTLEAWLGQMIGGDAAWMSVGP
jgi:hypothetical protein